MFAAEERTTLNPPRTHRIAYAAGFIFVLAITIGSSAIACEWCDQPAMDEEESDAPPQVHTPAVITKSPKLDKDDVAFILALDGGKRYAHLGDYIVDRTIKDPWGRLLDETSLIMLLRPRSRQLVADLRKKAANKALGTQDYALVAHLNYDIPTTAFEDWDFLRALAASATAADAHAPPTLDRTTPHS